jgi:cytoskeletal protein CcmA (bactofilin family)
VFGGKKEDPFAKGGHTLFDRALQVDGNVRFSGTLDIEGTVNGDIVAVDGEHALVRIRDKGCVNGEIRAPRILVNGCVNGDVYASKHLELAAKAEVNGDVYYQVIEMVKGSLVNGRMMKMDEPLAASVEAEPASKPTKAEEKLGAKDESSPAVANT